jgi:hypothetical protein
MFAMVGKAGDRGSVATEGSGFAGNASLKRLRPQYEDE